MEKEFYAHSIEGKGPEDWQPLEEHLCRVAQMASDFARPFGGEKWAYLAGLWHDLGKYSNEFQSYLRGQQLACSETLPGRVDHSTAGAQHAVVSMPILGHLLAYVIAGHHAGLLDAFSTGSCQEKRLKKSVPPWQHGLQNLPPKGLCELPKFIRAGSEGERKAFSISFFTRLLFSCLVDADFLDTEEFLDPNKTKQRQKSPKLEELEENFTISLAELEEKAPDKPINALRRAVRRECEEAANNDPGFFSLTVPTGGGKTLSSLAFAIKHAFKHGLRRIIYVVPFTTIIEQNADVFRKHLGEECVLEHHSNIDPEKETEAARLAAENWDAPVVVTTSVQFYEALFSNRPSRCRKLHRIIKSVIILDEAQTIPVEYLQPCLLALRELVLNYGCSVVLCTATQPALKKREGFEIGLENVREIINDPDQLYRSLQRVEMKRIDKQTDASLQKRLLKHKQVLCITNTIRHARQLFEMLGPGEGHFHLSARMCPAHRRERLSEIKEALAKNTVCRLISTQVVEAGVDIDFPVVFRAIAGLDAIVQAAGRCNRNAELPEKGKMIVFIPEDRVAQRYFADTASCAEQIFSLYEDPFCLQANEHFFRLYYWDQEKRWDLKAILNNFNLAQNREFPFLFDFAKTAADYRLIDDEATCTLVVPWGEKGMQVCERLRQVPSPGRGLLREAQPFMVQVYRREWLKHAGRSIRLIFDDLGILESPEAHYSEQTGLNLEAEGPGFYFA